MTSAISQKTSDANKTVATNKPADTNTTSAIKAVLFDLDGTLLDTSEDLAHALNHVRRQYGLTDLPYDMIRPHVSNGATALIRLGFGDDVSDEKMQALREALLAMYQQHIALFTKPFAGIETLIQQLADHGIAWGIVTNKPQIYTAELMQHFEFASAPCATVSPDQVGVSKPNPAGLLFACQAAGCQPAEAIYIGDHLRDIESGHNAGMPTIAVGYGFTSDPDEHRHWGATHIADTVAELWPIIEGYLEPAQMHNSLNE